jgi:hypothetical protein
MRVHEGNLTEVRITCFIGKNHKTIITARNINTKYIDGNIYTIAQTR